MSKSVKRGSEDVSGNTAKKPCTGHWANGLLSAMEDPNLRVYGDEQVVVIKDKYPKAQFHFLVLPKIHIPNLKKLDESHVRLLEYMQEVGHKITQKKQFSDHNFRFGYHAEPSMNHLHLHVISDDFCSDSLKTKKHYNSFTTDHFIDSQKVIDSLKNTGKVTVPSREECEKFLKQPLVCFKCGEEMTTMPKLKLHLKSHIAGTWLAV
ncbi:Aprataxin [Frankliniella fusca]|uniref:Aprataxin n=1 Tax=Frankliniella fusca TaxID=407009 RepID=A0AAE1HWJ9_9NEOP|nr:Aprataxin [Frankliniella fusca]